MDKTITSPEPQSRGASADRSVFLQAPATPRRSNLARSLHRFAADPLALVGAGLLVFVLLVGLLGPLIVPYDPIKMIAADRFQAPSAAHWFGTDHLGRDVFVRVASGALLSISAAWQVTILAAVLGLIIGGTSGFLGGYVDEAMMRITDVFQSFPWLLFAMAVAMALGPSMNNGILALSFVWWPGYARLMRGQVLSLKGRDYVHAAHAVGASRPRILIRHILPNALGPYIVLLTVGGGRVILATATLSFVGLGAQPPTPDWGVMVAEGRNRLFDAWWMATFPGLAILCTAVGLNLVGDGLQRFLDPTSRAI